MILNHDSELISALTVWINLFLKSKMKFKFSFLCLSLLVSAEPGSYINSNTVQKGYGNSASTSISHKDFDYGHKIINAKTTQNGVGNNSSTAIRSRSRSSFLAGAPFIAPRILPAPAPVIL
jgi:hypothetical protein